MSSYVSNWNLLPPGSAAKVGMPLIFDDITAQALAEAIRERAKTLDMQTPINTSNPEQVTQTPEPQLLTALVELYDYTGPLTTVDPVSLPDVTGLPGDSALQELLSEEQPLFFGSQLPFSGNVTQRPSLSINVDELPTV